MQGIGEPGDVPRRGVLGRVRQAGGVPEYGVGHAQLTGAQGHDGCEPRLVVLKVFGDRDRHVIGALDDEGADRVLDADRLSCTQAQFRGRTAGCFR
nr:hypothetical protein [Oceanicaulis sp.]